MDGSPTPTITIIKPLDPDPPFPPSSDSSDFSPLEFVLALFAVIIIPTLIYTFFLFIRCPPNPFERSRRSSESIAGEAATAVHVRNGTDDVTEAVTGLKYVKETHLKDIGGECPVCLSAFADGELVRQLTHCKHSFHASCIDIWLNSHSNCPVCRASVPVKVSDDS